MNLQCQELHSGFQKKVLALGMIEVNLLKLFSKFLQYRWGPDPNTRISSIDVLKEFDKGDRSS